MENLTEYGNFFEADFATAFLAILKLHEPKDSCCSHDGELYPCATVQIIETELAHFVKG